MRFRRILEHTSLTLCFGLAIGCGGTPERLPVVPEPQTPPAADTAVAIHSDALEPELTRLRALDLFVIGAALGRPSQSQADVKARLEGFVARAEQIVQQGMERDPEHPTCAPIAYPDVSVASNPVLDASLASLRALEIVEIEELIQDPHEDACVYACEYAKEAKNCGRAVALEALAEAMAE